MEPMFGLLTPCIFENWMVPHFEGCQTTEMAMVWLGKYDKVWDAHYLFKVRGKEEEIKL